MNRLLVIASFLLAGPAVADPIELTLEEFKMYRHYLKAMGDPRVQKIKPEGRMGAIAKDAGFKLRDLQRAVARGEAAGDVKAACESNLRQALEKTDLKGRISKIEVDAGEPHAVAYVQWLNENLAQLEEEASVIAATAQPACPVASTLQVWAQDKARPSVRVFQGLIAASAAAKIKPERAKDFADTRYIRLFEKVKSAAAGDDFTPETSGGEKASR
ncbi:MAG: hypothetical protein HYZ28_15410 [Myxococcales bacterium]|nr:hypothetical protein [Myxococcales bacterium]